MKKTFIFLCLCCCLSIQLHAQSSAYSYVRTRTMTNASATAWIDHIDYDNGIGDVYQQVDVGITPGHQDLVTLHEYDSHRRSYRVWLPGLGSGGNCQDSIALKSSAITINRDGCPYSTSIYEPTPLGQVRQQYQPGNAWYQNQKAQTFTEAVEANDVARYKVMNLIMASNTLLYTGYINNSKLIKETTDEDGVIHQEFADMSGNVVVRRQQSGTGWLATYYVYDDSNRLRFVLPPAAANYFETNLTYTQGISPTHDQMLKYAYEYRYDGRGNCIYKRLPGCEPVYYVYDHAGRLTTKTHKLDSNSTVTLESNAYNNLGRLVSTTSNGTLTTSYTYNVRSWLKTITTGTLFSETLYYDESHNGNNPCFSGNISAMDWKAPDNVQRGYRFYYDKLSRLTHAIYLESDVFNGHFNSEYSYDYMGNMLTLKRYGLQDNSSYGLVDNLTLTYNGNLLVKADDDATDPTYAGAFNFVDGEDEEVEYEYDQNGNLTKDLNKNILSIQYNLLNLPTGITYSDGRSAAYIYDAGGRKLRTSYQVSAQATPVPTDYCGNMIYENNVLNQILVDGGYITFSGTTPVYHCYLKDHLGNNRVVARADGTVEQVNHYYPFGGLMAESTDGDVQRYKYNGKELDRMHGLDWYDYGARHMDGARGQFTTKDPLCENFYNISPYIYCHNNPLNMIDIDGNWDVYIHLATDRSINGYGIAVVTDRNGQEMFKFIVRAEGVKGHDRMKVGADTPLGVYDIPNKNAWMRGGDRLSYGPNDRLIMNPKSGEIIESGRDNIRIHGGRQEVKMQNGDWQRKEGAKLAKTYGCLRASDDDMKTFKTYTDHLEATDKLETPGQVIVKDDIEEYKKRKNE